MIRWLAALWLTALLVVSPAVAQNFPARPNGPVLDEAGLLTPAQSVDISSKLIAFNERSGRALVVATVRSLGGREIEPYATELGRRWGIGEKKDNIGVLLLVAPMERKVWIATGYGGDDYLTDAMSGTIIRQDIIPKFKAGDMGGGIVAGVDAIIKQLELPPDQAAKRARDAERSQRAAMDSGGNDSFFFIILGLFLFFFFVRTLLFGRSRGGYRRRGVPPVVIWGPGWGSGGSSSSWNSGGSSWGGFGGGGGGGGGFGGFGGGSFGGGGAGGSW